MICIDIIMPGNCLECPCHDREYGHCQVDPNIDTYEGISDRPRRCPLVELKESPETFNKDSKPESMLNADLISRQVAKDAICKEWCGCDTKHCPHSSDEIYYCDGCDDARIIDKLPSVQPEQKWIPVSERLPNREEYIKNNGLFNVSDGNRSYSEWFDIYDKQRFGEPTMYGFRVDRCVIAWMPLPEPWKAESEG